MSGRTRFLAFMLSGALAGLSGYLWISRYAVAYVDIASGFELDVVAACVIGGISISGGIGSVGGAVLGALFLGVMKNALPVIGVSPFWQMAISGAVIIIAVAFNARAERKKGRIILKSAEARIMSETAAPRIIPDRLDQPRLGNGLELGIPAPRRARDCIHDQLLRLALFPRSLEPVRRHVQLHGKGADCARHGAARSFPARLTCQSRPSSLSPPP